MSPLRAFWWILINGGHAPLSHERPGLESWTKNAPFNLGTLKVVKNLRIHVVIRSNDLEIEAVDSRGPVAGQDLRVPRAVLESVKPVSDEAGSILFNDKDFNPETMKNPSYQMEVKQTIRAVPLRTNSSLDSASLWTL